MNKAKEIRFTDSRGNALFSVPDGGFLRLFYGNGDDNFALCRYVDEADQKSVWYKPTEKAKEYRAYEREMRDRMYEEISARCGEYDRKHRNKDLER